MGDFHNSLTNPVFLKNKWIDILLKNNHVLSSDQLVGYVTTTIKNDSSKVIENFYYHLDHLNSTKCVTKQDGTVEVLYEYRAFGEQLKRLDKEGNDTTDKAKYSFSGKELDTATNLYYFNQRYYDPTIGRFINVDPVQSGDNWYVYVSNNPMNAIDPTGLDYILLNRSYGAYNEGHNAALVGSDKGGFVYFSKDNGRENTKKYFKSIEAFYKSDIAKTYDRSYRIETKFEDDLKMIKKGTAAYSRKYSLNEKYDENGKIISQNCADLAAEIAREVGIKMKQPKDSRFPIGTFTDPNQQFEQFMNDNKTGTYHEATEKSNNDKNIWQNNDEKVPQNERKGNNGDMEIK